MSKWTTHPTPAGTPPCPVCSRTVKLYESETGFVIGCVGDRHCLQLYRGVSAEEVLAGWRKYFPGTVNSVGVQP